MAEADTPSVVQAMCTAQGRQGAWQRLSQGASGSRGQVQGMQTLKEGDEKRI